MREPACRIFSAERLEIAVWRVMLALVATHHHPAWPKGVLAVNLLDRVPARLLDGRRDELFADIRF